MVLGGITLWCEVIPFGELEWWITGIKSSNEVVFTGLDVAFGGIAAVVVWRYTLVIYIVFCENSFQVGRALVV